MSRLKAPSIIVPSHATPLVERIPAPPTEASKDISRKSKHLSRLLSKLIKRIKESIRSIMTNPLKRSFGPANKELRRGTRKRKPVQKLSME